MHQLIDKKRLTIYSFFFLFLSSINNVSLIKYKDNLTILKYIEVKGLNENLNFKVKKKLEYLLNTNIYEINKKNIKKELEKYNYIEKYKVTKFYPSKLLFQLKQAKFIATTLKNNKKYIIGSNGKLIDYNIVNLEKDLPNVFGNFKIKDFILLNEVLKKTNFEFKNIKDIFFFPSGRWDIKTKNNLTVKLPKKNINKAINKLNLIIQSDELNKYNVIDLRIVNQVILSNE